VTIDAPGLTRLPEALARRVVLRALELADTSRSHGLKDTEAVLTLATGRRLQLGAVRLELIDDSFVLTNRASSSRALSAQTDSSSGRGGLPLRLEIPGVARHPDGLWMVEARGPIPPEAPMSGPHRVVLDAAALGRHLTIRAWQPGDRVQPLGLGGRKKLQDVFVDRKLPRDERGLVPVVLDARERIAWVAGHVVGEPFRVTPHSASVVVLTLRR
jgi:tRNA(Ile)-lysidine synthase